MLAAETNLKLVTPAALNARLAEQDSRFYPFTLDKEKWVVANLKIQGTDVIGPIIDSSEPEAIGQLFRINDRLFYRAMKATDRALLTNNQAVIVQARIEANLRPVPPDGMVIQPSIQLLDFISG